MVATLFLLSCTWAPAQTPDGPAVSPPLREAAEGIPVPRLSRAMELLYRGAFTEESTSGGVQFSRAYKLENRVLVLETTPRGAEVAFLTTLRSNAPGAHGDAAPASVRLEVAQVDPQGRVIAENAEKGMSLAIPLEGPPPVECGAFVEMPHHRPRAGQPWDVTEDGRPARTWQLAGTETVNGTSCLKLVGVQQSEDWDRPRADHTAWRRQDTVWLSPRLGVAYRVEREVLRREPARDEPHHKALLRYELDYNLPYTRQLFDDCGDEIYKTRSFLETAAPWLASPGRYGPQLEAHLARINYYLDNHPAHTPYREALLQVKRRVEAAKRGESPPAPPPEEGAVTTAPAVAALGEAAPDFLATDFTHKQGARLRAWQGKPVLLVFYSPTSFQAEELLRFAQELADRHKDHVAVLGLAMTDDAERVLHQRDTLQLTFPLLDGTGLRAAYDVKETPKVMVLDANGIVCGSWVGWGQEVPGAVAEELKRCLARHKP
jgi:peroxiredoxin